MPSIKMFIFATI